MHKIANSSLNTSSATKREKEKNIESENGKIRRKRRRRVTATSIRYRHEDIPLRFLRLLGRTIVMQTSTWGEKKMAEDEAGVPWFAAILKESKRDTLSFVE